MTSRGSCAQYFALASAGACLAISTVPSNALLPPLPFQFRTHKASLDASPSSSNLVRERMLPDSAYETILTGKIAIVPNFLSPPLVSQLRSDAKELHSSGLFSTDALAAYGTNGKFDPSKDRTVLKLPQWKRTDVGDPTLRHETLGNIMANLRTDLSRNLNRPNLDRGTSITKYGKGSTEISYTRFGPGAYLKRHVDEHHEELKGKNGWSQPTRRSISWLVYLNEDDWDPRTHGGFLRCFQRKVRPSADVGARSNGDLQIGWLRSSTFDPVERPVFLNARRRGPDGTCAMYIVSDVTDAATNGNEGARTYISKDFHPHPVLFLSNGDFFARKLLINSPTLASRFHFLEPPKSASDAILNVGKPTTPSEAEFDEMVLDVPPLGGTLVLFDSVSLPHEVLPSTGRERWACSGWYHEDQQEPAVMA